MLKEGQGTSNDRWN